MLKFDRISINVNYKDCENVSITYVNTNESEKSKLYDKLVSGVEEQKRCPYCDEALLIDDVEFTDSANDPKHYDFEVLSCERCSNLIFIFEKENFEHSFKEIILLDFKKESNDNFIRLLDDPESIKNLTSVEFEEVSAMLIHYGDGLDVSYVTTSSNDDGVDSYIISRNENLKNKIIVQSKHNAEGDRCSYKGPIRELVGSMVLKDANIGYLISTNEEWSHGTIQHQIDFQNKTNNGKKYEIKLIKMSDIIEIINKIKNENFKYICKTAFFDKK